MQKCSYPLLSYREGQMERIESDSDYYYEVLSINDRLIGEITKKYPTIYGTKKILGKTYIKLYTGIGSIKKLNNICEKLGIDFGYCLTGRDHFRGYNLQKLINHYNKQRYKNENTESIRSIISIIRHGKDNIKIATLLKISRILKINLKDLISA